MADDQRVQVAMDWPEGACSIDHDGCVVCSDAGIPMRVVALDQADALCEDVSGARMLIAVELVQPVQVGDMILTHGGVAIAHGTVEVKSGSKGEPS